MNRNTLLTAAGWEGKYPPMPGRFGPTYRDQIAFVERWMPPMMRDFNEKRRWRQDPALIFKLYRDYLELSRFLEPIKEVEAPKPWPGQ